MNEVDRGVGLEQVAPGTLARVRLAGDQQHAQILADALDLDRGAVVDLGQFARHRVGFELDEVEPAVRHVDRQFARRPRRHHLGRQRVAVAGDCHLHAGGFIGDAIVDHAEADGLLLADDAEARRLVDHDAPVALALVARNQRVDRCLWKLRRVFGNVVHLSVGQHDHATDLLGRYVRQRGGERPEQLCPVYRRAAVGAAGLDRAHAHPVKRAELGLQRGRGRGSRLVPSVERLAGALVHDQRHHRRQWLPVLVEQHGVRQRQQERQRRQRPQPPAAQPPDYSRDHDRERQPRHPGKERQWQQRREAERPGHCPAYCPSRSSSAGTWTWSAL